MDKFYYLDGLVLNYLDQNRTLHRLGGPAIEYKNGDGSWYQNGKLHREDGPALDWMSQTIWCKNGQYHRLDGPAVEWTYGDDEWYINGKKLIKEEFEKHILIMQLSGLLNG